MHATHGRAPLADWELARTMERVRSVQLRPPVDRKIQHLVGAHLAAPNADGRMLVVTRGRGAMLSTSIGTVLRSMPVLKPMPSVAPPIIDIQVEAGCPTLGLGLGMLEALGVHRRPKDEHETWRLLRKRLARRGIAVVSWNIQGAYYPGLDPWIERTGTLVGRSLLAEGCGRLFICTGSWPPERVFPWVGARRETKAVTDEALAHGPEKLLLDAIEEMARQAGLTVMGDIGRRILPRLMAEGRSPNAQLQGTARAIARALAPRDPTGARLPPSTVLAARHYRFEAH
ncbi:hypothetical protein [Lichenibacterium dinghuense]|uniref:hypothetical protein n=1 Tax=Lichenibacterium dinghuense TaxID=2895977 RepID=UPI001F2AC9BD|nr:hypothetical protein [Lichenibacterium sp. 6Y81]